LESFPWKKIDLQTETARNEVFGYLEIKHSKKFARVSIKSEAKIENPAKKQGIGFLKGQGKNQGRNKKD
jgi:hypothetical protein